MSTELGRALERVARRYRHVRLWSGLALCWLAWRLYRAHDNAGAMPLFHYSCLYLFAVFGSLTLDRLLGLLSHAAA